MIERNNIINLLSKRVNVYHSAILTCYNFDSVFFESVYLPKLRKIGVVNIIVVMDAGIYDSMLNDINYKYHPVGGADYTLLRKANNHFGVFHSKITMLFGKEEGILIAGSGNITFSGLSQNEEIWNAFHIKGNESPFYPLYYNAWKYIKGILHNIPFLARKQIDWIEENSEWIVKKTDNLPVVLKNGESLWLLYNDTSNKIFDSLVSIINKNTVKEITAIAPFYDNKGEAITALKKAFNPSSFRCILDKERHSAPSLLFDKEYGFSFYEYLNKSHLLHAKLFEFKTDSGTWIMSGSANASGLAFGTNSNRYNDELCILIHNPKNIDYINELELISNINQIKNEELRKFEALNPNKKETSEREVYINYSEYDETGLHISFSEEGHKGSLLVLDKQANVRFKTDITTIYTINVNIPDEIEGVINFVVLQKDGVDISNRSLVIRENQVEKQNPDSKHRELTKLLTEEGLFENLDNILKFISFEEKNEINVSSGGISTNKQNENDDGPSIQKEDFYALKDKTKQSISSKPNVQILDYISLYLFKVQTEAIGNDQNQRLEEANPEDDSSYDEQVVDYNLAQKSEDIILRYLKRMNKFYVKKIKQTDESCAIAGEVDHLHIFTDKPDINAFCSLAIACKMVSYMVSTNGALMTKKDKIKTLLLENSTLFFAIYYNHFPSENTNEDKKSRIILTEAIAQLMAALSSFYFYKEENDLILSLLNCFDYCGKTSTQLLNDSFNQYCSLINEMDTVKDSTVSLIKKIYSVYSSKTDNPLINFSIYMDTIFIRRNKYGFLLAKVKHDNNVESNIWKYTYHHPRMKYITPKIYYGVSKKSFIGYRSEVFH